MWWLGALPAQMCAPSWPPRHSSLSSARTSAVSFPTGESESSSNALEISVKKKKKPSCFNLLESQSIAASAIESPPLAETRG